MTQEELKAEDRRWRRGDLLAVLGAVLLGVALAVIVISIQGLRNDLQVANEARDALATQVEGLGATPIAGEPGSRGEVGPSGPPGRPGRDAPPVTPAPGPTGPEGDPGDPGSAGSPGEPGSDSTVPGPSGVAGQNGQDGRDSTIPGPTGPPGQNGQDGAPGQDGSPGEPGEPGTDGTDGADGEPPASWTYTDPAGFSYTCRRVDDFDPASPRYTCSPDGPPDPAQSAAGLLVLMSLAAYRRLSYGYRDSLS